MSEAHDIIVVGSGPASAVFLHAWLERAGKDARALVLEKGPMRTHAWRMQGDEDRLLDGSTPAVTNPHSRDKPWKFALAVGGTSSLWWGCTPRFLPEDFELKRRYGVGRDWPLGYDELEPHYGEVEAIFQVAGDSEDTPFRRSTPYPLAAHRFTEPERILKKAWPDHFFRQPCARPTRALPAGPLNVARPKCCANGVCGRCPIDSKFTVLNGLAKIFEDPRVELRTGCAVQAVETTGGVATGVRYVEQDWPEGAKGRERLAKAELVALGANALFNPHILLRSGLRGSAVGRGLSEQASIRVVVHLDGVDNFQGSTSVTGHGYMLYGGEHRRERAAGLIETWNVPRLRPTPGKLLQVMASQFIYEDLPRDENRVILDPADPSKPKVSWSGRSEYAEASLARVREDAEKAFAPLPIDDIWLQDEGKVRDTEGHILGSTRMGTDPADSVVDRELKHHQVRNLLVLGGSVFPTVSPSNPTLTIGALSRWAAAHL